MVRYIFFVISLFYLFACQQPTKAPNSTEEAVPEKNKTIIFNDTIPIPEGFKVLAQAEGDLNKDQIVEKIVIYDTPRETDMGTEREIYIFRKGREGWLRWHNTTGGLLPSKHGGIFDPFRDARIERGSIVIEHLGGNRQSWSYLHRYRFQNEDWELIGATIGFGIPCANWETFDYNLSTGDIHYQLEKENCEGEDKRSEVMKEARYSVIQDDLPSMDSMYPGNNGVEISNTDLVFYY